MPRPSLPDSTEAARRSNDVYTRVMAANRQKPVDEIPPVVWASEPFLSGYAGVGRREYYEAAEAKYYAQAKFQLDFPDILHLPGVAPDYGYAPETSAWGSPIKQEEDGPLVPFAAVNDIHELPALEMPDPWTAGYMAIALNDYAWYADHMDPVIAQTWGHFEGYGRCMGVESGALVLGYERYLIELYGHPQLIHDWNKRVVEANVAYVRAQERITGTIERLVVTDHLAGQVGQAHCEEFVYPYLKDIFDAFSVSRVPSLSQREPGAGYRGGRNRRHELHRVHVRDRDGRRRRASWGACLPDGQRSAHPRSPTTRTRRNHQRLPAAARRGRALGRHVAVYGWRTLTRNPSRPHPRIRRLRPRRTRSRGKTRQLAVRRIVLNLGELGKL